MKNLRNRRAGVALIEFTVGLIAVIVAVGAMIQLGLLGMARTDTMISATEGASMLSMAPDSIYQPLPSYLYSWDPGEDEARHSRDDVGIEIDPAAVHQAIYDTARPRELSFYAPDAPLAQITTPGEMILSFEMLQGATTRVGLDLLPVVRNLVYRRDSMNIRSEAWSVGAGGL